MNEETLYEVQNCIIAKTLICKLFYWLVYFNTSKLLIMVVLDIFYFKNFNIVTKILATMPNWVSGSSTKCANAMLPFCRQILPHRLLFDLCFLTICLFP